MYNIVENFRKSIMTILTYTQAITPINIIEMNEY